MHDYTPLTSLFGNALSTSKVKPSPLRNVRIKSKSGSDGGDARDDGI